MKKVDLIVIKVQSNREFGNSRPCFNCLKLMKIVGIRKIYYSIGPGEIMCERVKNMVSIHVSRPRKLLDNIYFNTPENEVDYIKNIIKRGFPKQIKKINLGLFLRFNFNFLPKSFEYIIIKIKGKEYIQLIENNKIVIISEII